MLLCKTSEKIIKSRKLTQLAEPYAPVIDNKIVAGNPFDLIRSKKVLPNVPILSDNTANEGDTYIMQIFGSNITQNKEVILPGEFWYA